MSTHWVYLSLGSNLGDKEYHLREAVRLIGDIPTTRLVKKSSLYLTEPVGFTEQDYFLNAVILVETKLEPLDLLDNTQRIENSLGRERLVRWGPRTLDIDILLYDDQHINHSRLLVPHGEMHRRLFVLKPLEEIAPSLTVPGFGLVKDLIANIQNSEKITLVKMEEEW